MPLQAAHGKVIVCDIERGTQVTAGGIVLTDDDGTSAGVRARWAKVYAVGDSVHDVKVGHWILIQHGRWTRGIQYEGDTIYMVDYPNGVLAMSEDENKPDFISVGLKKSREYEYKVSEFTDYAKDRLL